MLCWPRTPVSIPLYVHVCGFLPSRSLLVSYCCVMLNEMKWNGFSFHFEIIFKQILLRHWLRRCRRSFKSFSVSVSNFFLFCCSTKQQFNSGHSQNGQISIIILNLNDFSHFQWEWEKRKNSSFCCAAATLLLSLLAALNGIVYIWECFDAVLTFQLAKRHIKHEILMFEPHWMALMGFKGHV